MSCTLPAPTAIDNFAVTIKSSASVVTYKAWSLDLHSMDFERRVLTFQSSRKMYPPRIVLNFHFNTFGFLEPTGSCSFTLLTERLTTTTLPTTSRITQPWMRPPTSMRDRPMPLETDTESSTTSWATTSSTESPTMTSTTNTLRNTSEYSVNDADPCLQAWITFPPTRYGFPDERPAPDGGETTTEGTSTLPSRDKLLPGFGIPLFKRAIFSPATAPMPMPDQHLQPVLPVMQPPLIINYPDAIEKSMMFYAAQRSGDFEKAPLSLPYDWVRSSGTFHLAPDGRDLTGGWYNGNDNVKLTFPMAAATTVLAWGYNSWKEVYQYNSSRLDEQFKETLKWPLDYFLKSWDLSNETLYVQIGNLSKERTLWNRADDYLYNTLWNNNEWPVYSVSPSNPGSDVAAEVATAMALSSLIEFDSMDGETTTEGTSTTAGIPGRGRPFPGGGIPLFKRSAPDNVPYSTRLLDTAEEIYQFAKSYPGIYSDSVPVGGAEYPDYTSSGYEDEMCFAAAVLYNITAKKIYLNDAKSYFATFENAGTPDFFSWDDKRTACAVMLYKGTKDDKYATFLEGFRNHWMATTGEFTPNGFAWRNEEGPLRYTANAIFILLQSIDAGVFQPDIAMEIYKWSANQIDYMLGANGMQYSYLIGYSDYHVTNPYHKNSACNHPAKPCGWTFYNSEWDNINKLVGALVGGPNLNDYHADNRQNKIGNSVAVDYNAGFQSVLAGLQKQKLALQDACDALLEGINGGSGIGGPLVDPTIPTGIFDNTTDSEEITTSGTGETPTTPYTTTEPTPIPKKPESFDYVDALKKSMLFYAAQRSGTEPENNPIPWRRWDSEEKGTASGGWFDDGSAVKTTKVMASAALIIGWGGVNFKAGYEIAGALSDLRDCLRWPLDYFLNIWNPEEQTLVQKVGFEVYERAFWSRPERTSTLSSSDIVKIRVNQGGGGEGADVAADVATALAIGSVIFKDNDTGYSARLLSAAKEVYSFAKQLNETFKDPSSIYYSDPGDDFDDEMCVAAWWMYKATQESQYYDDGMTFETMKVINAVLEWKDKYTLCNLLQYEFTGSTAILGGMEYWMKGVVTTPQGLVWQDYESLKFAGNAALLHALCRNEGIMNNPSELYLTQIEYILGRNENAFSYQIGYGSRYPRRPHHRSSSCPDYMDTCDWSIYNSPSRNPFELTGALVGGPDMNDAYEDVRSNEKMNRVSVEHNAGFQSVLAYIVMEHPPSKKTPTATEDPVFPPETDPINETSGAVCLIGSMSAMLYFTFILLSCSTFKL
ncbi:uncharacterized protein LOC123528279 [Mercenaria mercenaria]|uniref:uncharacterized protein LOC123528279 n=1 Tax=Mercenaria mercenaria TaxID=6596 RepID=UPI00234F8CF2|nr:uncharacterized protein LOC123528279 [Mercenaria mercenaria]